MADLWSRIKNIFDDHQDREQKTTEVKGRAEEIARLELLDHFAEKNIDSNVVDKGREWQASSHIQEAQDKAERDLRTAMNGFGGSYRELLAREEVRDFRQMMKTAPEMPPLWNEGEKSLISDQETREQERDARRDTVNFSVKDLRSLHEPAITKAEMILGYSQRSPEVRDTKGRCVNGSRNWRLVEDRNCGPQQSSGELPGRSAPALLFP